MPESRRGATAHFRGSFLLYNSNPTIFTEISFGSNLFLDILLFDVAQSSPGEDSDYIKQ